MLRNSLLLLLAITYAPRADAGRSQLDVLVRDLASPNGSTRLEALRVLEERGDDSAPAVAAVIEMMARVGSSAVELRFACGILAHNPDRAADAFPLLSEWMVESEGELQVFLCLENVARAAGPASLPKALAATALIARKWLPLVQGDPRAMFDVMATARRAWSRPLDENRSEAVSVLAQALASNDDFVRAEAAGFLAGMGRDATSSVAALQQALKRETSPWAAHEMKFALSLIVKE